MATTRQDSTFHTHTLPNGLQLLGQHMPDVQSAAVVFWVNTGTRDENPNEMGVSHFLEHMAFKRTPKYTGQEIDRAFEAMGADHNAGTSREMTYYWARTLGDTVPKAVDVLSQLTHPVLDASDFDQERQVILEEIARAEDQASHVLISNFLRDYFAGHPLALDTLGTSDTIKNLTIEEMRDYWAKRYGTRNMVFAIAGNFSWDEVVHDMEARTENWQQGETGRRRQVVPFHPGLYVYPREQFVQEQIAIGVPAVPRSDRLEYAAAVLATILGDDRGSRLFWALYQTGLAETATAEVLDFEDNGVLIVHISASPEHAADALREARKQMQQLQSGNITADELARAKTKITTSVVLGGESTNERVMGLINSWLTHGRLETLEDIKQRIEDVTMDDLHELLEKYPLYPDQAIVATGPLGDEEIRLGL